MNHINFRHSLLPVLFGILLFSVSCSSGHKTGITWDKEFHVVQRTALEKNQNFCITLIDTTNRTSQIYLERLYEHTPDAIFNLVNAEPGIANWYSQWLYSISTPVTCIFTPEGKLIDIIPGASRKCFRCIKEVAENGKMTRNLAYYNNFSIYCISLFSY